MTILTGYTERDNSPMVAVLSMCLTTRFAYQHGDDDIPISSGKDTNSVPMLLAYSHFSNVI